MFTDRDVEILKQITGFLNPKFINIYRVNHKLVNIASDKEIIIIPMYVLPNRLAIKIEKNIYLHRGYKILVS